MSGDGISQALREWRAVVGDAHVVADGPELDAAGRATFATRSHVLSIVRPADRGEVAACLRIANGARVPLYPISGGKNWGFGSRVPPRDAALLDLGRLDRIVDYDEELGYLTVEPGVTFEAAHAFLRAKNSTLMLNSTGGSPKASLVGNALERGDGAGPHGDRFAHVTGLEVVLPTGECVHTGFERFGGTPLGPLHRWGVGPALDGLFSQSPFGVVTRMTFWLCPLPKSLHLVRFELSRTEELGPVVDAIRRLRMEGTIRSAVGIWNDYRAISTERQYPWDLTRGETPLPRALLETLKHPGSGAWFGVTALYAPSVEQGRAARRQVERVLSPVVGRLQVEEHAGSPTAGRELSVDDPALRFSQGVPHEASLRSVYWRKKTPIPADLDPDRDGCGVLWVCPTLPLRGADILSAVAPAEATLVEHGFEPLLAMIAQTDRTMYLVPLIIYDRDVDGADASALACHDALLARFNALGYLPHRLGIHGMAAVPRARDDHATLLLRLSRALDPNGVLAPGRYAFEDDPSRSGE